MRFLISHTTTAALLVHLGLGCCWHHNHRCTTISDDVAAEITSCDHGGHHLQHCAPRGHIDNSPCPSDHTPFDQGCDDDCCTFVLTEPPSVQKEELNHQLCQIDGPLSFGVAAVPGHLGATDVVAGCGTGDLRAHLVYGVLLI